MPPTNVFNNVNVINNPALPTQEVLDVVLDPTTGLLHTGSNSPISMTELAVLDVTKAKTVIVATIGLVYSDGTNWRKAADNIILV